MPSYEEIESKRCADVFYGLLFNPTIRQNVFQNTLEIFEGENKNKERSFRLDLAINRIKATDIILLQHVFIFFAIVQEPNVKHFIINHYKPNTGRRREVEAFVEGPMTEKTNDLVNGKYRSITEYIDDLRGTLTMEIGFE